MTAVQAGSTAASLGSTDLPQTKEIIDRLVEKEADLEARTAHSGLLVSKAGPFMLCSFGCATGGMRKGEWAVPGGGVAAI